MYNNTILAFLILSSFAQIRSKNVTAAVEVLHEAEDVGVNIGSIAFGKHVLEGFTIYCSHSINLLDSLYYALVSDFIVCLHYWRSGDGLLLLNRLTWLDFRRRKRFRSML